MESKFYAILETISPESEIFVYIAQYGVIGYLLLAQFLDHFVLGILFAMVAGEL